MLEAIGLDKQAESVYRVMLADPTIRLPELARSLGEAEDTVRRALERLSRLALVGPDLEGGSRAVRPEVGIERLLARQQAELAERRQQIEESRIAAARLISECSSLVQDTEDPATERLIGIDAIRDRIGALTRQVEEEIMTFAPGGAQRPADLAVARTVDRPMLERGVRMRTLWLDSIRNDQPTLDYATWLHSLGGRARTVPTLPVRMIIMDRKHAVLPMDTSDATIGAIVLHSQGTVAALCALFDTTWERGMPLGHSHTLDDRGLSPQEAEFLRLLGQGLTDQAISVRLGVSHRTARRVAAGLMEKLDARSRFEAGLKAGERGWLRSGD
ncbi:LuxR C-terminal-related transcriptional regulator [Streptomyces sp. NPDC088915]|uniref:LuxR C-terminal-related transcriptional regulator n=1 Tax=Streptomyces sp. NPDC088915 TaxID=3365912 RepID=UPI0038014920